MDSKGGVDMNNWKVIEILEEQRKSNLERKLELEEADLIHGIVYETLIEEIEIADISIKSIKECEEDKL